MGTNENPNMVTSVQFQFIPYRSFFIHIKTFILQKIRLIWITQASYTQKVTN